MDKASMVKARLFPGARTTVDVVRDALQFGGSWYGARDIDGVYAPPDAAVIEVVHDEIVRQHEASGEDVFMLDVGANTGSFALLAAELPYLHVTALEPNLDAVCMLHQNVDANDLHGRVEVLPAAAGSSAGLDVISYHVEGGRASLGTIDAVIGRELVSVVTLPMLYAARPFTVIKIDAEGAEYEILEGARDLLARVRPYLVIEICDDRLRQCGATAGGVFQLLASMGATWTALNLTTCDFEVRW